MDSDDDDHPTPCENWQYTIDNWIWDNEYALLYLYEDMQKGISNIGGNVLTKCNFFDFCQLVRQISWVPELGLHVASPDQ